MLRWFRASRLVPVLAAILICWTAASAQRRQDDDNLQAVLAQRLPLLGHRNWIMVVDSAYPLQQTPGMEVVMIHAGLVQVLRETLAAIAHSPHVRANVFQDAELAYLPEQDAPGITAFRSQVKDVLTDAHLDKPAVSLPHADLIARMAVTSKDFHILVLKTEETLPYTSAFLQLDCRYWSDAAETRLRQSMRR